MIPASDRANDVMLSVRIIDDRIREMSETFNLIIDPSSLPNGVTSSNNATVTILDQDGECGGIHCRLFCSSIAL